MLRYNIQILPTWSYHVIWFADGRWRNKLYTIGISILSRTISGQNITYSIHIYYCVRNINGNEPSRVCLKISCWSGHVMRWSRSQSYCSFSTAQGVSIELPTLTTPPPPTQYIVSCVGPRRIPVTQHSKHWPSTSTTHCPKWAKH